MTTGDEKQPPIMQAFARFQQQCEQLEATHVQLRQRLANAELELENKNKELAERIAEIEEIQEKLSTVVESIDDALILIDRNNEAILANRAANEMFSNEIYGSTSKAINQLFAELLTSTKPRRGKEFNIDSDKGQRAVIASISPILGADENEHRVLSIKDVTEYRILQERVAREDRLSALGQVATSVAHEIRNPLGAIEGFARLLHGDLLKDLPDKAPLAEKVVYAAHQVNCVVGNLLNFARGPKCTFFPQDMGALVDEVFQMVEPMAADADVELLLEKEECSMVGLMDGVQLKQVIGNLMVNAVEACPVKKDGRVKVAISGNNSTITLSVQDNGCGIPEHALNSIFEPFFTLKDGGVGLGLAMCKRIVEAHTGTITATSQPDNGTIFKVIIPREQVSND